MADGSHLDGHFVKKKFIASRKETSDTILTLIHSEVLQNCNFHVYAILVTAANGHLGLPSGINLKKLYL